MATVINARERSTAFWKFIFFFVISTALVTGAIYFDMRIPSKDNEVLREQVSRYRIQSMAQEKFVQAMDDSKNLIDSLRRPGANQLYLNQQIAARIRSLSDLQYKDSSMFSRLNKNVIDVFLRYQEATNKAVSMGDLPRQLEDYKARYEESQRDLDNARRDLDVIRRSNGGTF